MPETWCWASGCWSTGPTRMTLRRSAMPPGPGVATGWRCCWRPGPIPGGAHAVARAMGARDHDAVRTLLEHGARIDEAMGGDTPAAMPVLHRAARGMSDAPMVALLLAAGADPGRRYQGVTAYGHACVFGNADLARAIEAAGNVPGLTPEERLLAMAADGEVPAGTYLDPAKLPEAYRNIIRLILHLPGKMAHIKRLVAMGAEYDRPDADGLTPVQIAGWEGLPDRLAYFLALKPDLGHVNGYGGTLLSTIIHGSENCPDRGGRDHVGCLRLALEQGVALPAKAADGAGDPKVAAFLSDWARAHPGQVVPGGAA